MSFFEAIPEFFVVRTWLMTIRHRYAPASLVFLSLPHNIMSAPFDKRRRPVSWPWFSSRISLCSYYNILLPPPLRSHPRPQDSRALPDRQAYYPAN